MSSGRFRVVILFMILALISGCYGPCAAVETTEVGLQMGDGVTIDDVVGEGLYTDLDPLATLVRIDVSAKTFTWSDPELVTRDKQPIGIELGYTVRRNPNPAAIKEMYKTYRAESVDDVALQTLINNRIPRVVKEITARYTLNEMLGVSDGGELAPNRTLLQKDIFELLETELNESNIVLIDVGVNNISPSADFMEALKRKAAAQIQAEIERTEASTLIDQLAKEKAKTNIELEKAERENLVALEKAKVMQQSPEALELRKLEIVAGAFSDKDKIFFVTPGTDLSLFFSNGTMNPVVNEETIPMPPPVDQPAPIVE